MGYRTAEKQPELERRIMEIKLSYEQFEKLHEILWADDRASFKTPNMDVDMNAIEPESLIINGSSIKRESSYIVISLPDVK
jgi:hypothetical protein